MWWESAKQSLHKFRRYQKWSSVCLPWFTFENYKMKLIKLLDAFVQNKKVFSRLCKVFVINQLHATWHTAFGRHETFTSQHTGTAFENVNIFHKIQVLYPTYLFGFLYPIYIIPWCYGKRNTWYSPTPAHWLCTKWVAKGRLAFRAETIIYCPAPSNFWP